MKAAAALQGTVRCAQSATHTVMHHTGGIVVDIPGLLTSAFSQMFLSYEFFTFFIVKVVYSQ